MKIFVSYVIQDEKGHKHRSEIIDSENNDYSYLPDPTVPQVMDWTEKKRKYLQPNEELVVTSMYKVHA